MIDHFVSFTTYPIFNTFLRLIYFYFNIFYPYGIVLCCYFLIDAQNKATKTKHVSLLRFFFLSHVQVFSCEISLVCRGKYSYNCFSSHFCFLVIVGLLIHVLLVLFLIAVISISLYYYYYYSLRVFHTSVSWWHFTA